jgi:hypothetical protein
MPRQAARQGWTPGRRRRHDPSRKGGGGVRVHTWYCMSCFNTAAGCVSWSAASRWPLQSNTSTWSLPQVIATSCFACCTAYDCCGKAGLPADGLPRSLRVRHNHVGWSQACAPGNSNGVPSLQDTQWQIQSGQCACLLVTALSIPGTEDTLDGTCGAPAAWGYGGAVTCPEMLARWTADLKGDFWISPPQRATLYGHVPTASAVPDGGRTRNTGTSVPCFCDCWNAPNDTFGMPGCEPRPFSVQPHQRQARQRTIRTHVASGAASARR